METSVDLLLRFAHLFTAIVLVGGAVGGAFLGQPSVSPFARNAVFGGIAILVTSGLIQMMNLISNVPKGWHMWFGIKFLLALHVFAMIFLMTKPDATPEKRKRWQLSALIGTAAVVAAGIYLRSLRGV